MHFCQVSIFNVSLQLLYFLLRHVQAVLSAYQEKSPARYAVNAHAQDFAASDELLLAILKTSIPKSLNKQQKKSFMCTD
jgi:hypothetical protein